MLLGDVFCQALDNNLLQYLVNGTRAAQVIPPTLVLFRGLSLRVRLRLRLRPRLRLRALSSLLRLRVKLRLRLSLTRPFRRGGGDRESRDGERRRDGDRDLDREL